jgi:hypothetical protein
MILIPARLLASWDVYGYPDFIHAKFKNNGVHSASWWDKLSSYLNKEVTVRFGKLKIQLWDSMCWPHVNPVPSGAVAKDCQLRLLRRPRFVRAVAPRIMQFIYKTWFKTQS